MNNTKFFVIDVESVGLHGEGFAVAGGMYINGSCQWEFRYCCDMELCEGRESDRKWVKENVPVMEITHRSSKSMRDAFWKDWIKAKSLGATLAADCAWPVETRFLTACIDDDRESRNWEGPYPLAEISSYMASAGFDPLDEYVRLPSEMPKHEPLADVRQSARMLFNSLSSLEKDF
jgi:hypothetical protein